MPIFDPRAQASVSPNDNAPALFVPEGADDDHNEINKRPDTQPAQREELEYPGADLTNIKPVRAEYPEKPAQQQRGEPAPGTGVRRS